MLEVWECGMKNASCLDGAWGLGAPCRLWRLVLKIGAMKCAPPVWGRLYEVDVG